VEEARCAARSRVAAVDTVNEAFWGADQNKSAHCSVTFVCSEASSCGWLIASSTGFHHQRRSFPPRQFQPPDSSPASVSSGRGLDRKSSEQHLSPVQHAFTECQPLERGRSLSPRSINTSPAAWLDTDRSLDNTNGWPTRTTTGWNKLHSFSHLSKPPEMRYRPVVFTPLGVVSARFCTSAYYLRLADNNRHLRHGSQRH
jgi:hypothetical protein